MERWAGKVAIVTGASAGIGAAIARAFVHHGLIVVGLARRQDNILKISEELKAAGEPGSLHALKTDLRKEEDILAAFSWVETNLGGADILINNAGIVHLADISEGKTENWRAIFDINVLAASICTREYLKSMEKRNNQNGHIFVINSVAGHIADFPGNSMYCGSKFAMKAITTCLRGELRKKESKIKVTSISPGVTDTEILNNCENGESVKEKFQNVPLLKGDDVAAAIVDALSASPVSQICEVVLTPVPTLIGAY